MHRNPVRLAAVPSPAPVASRGQPDPADFPPSWVEFARARERALTAMTGRPGPHGRRPRHLWLVGGGDTNDRLV